MWRMLHGKPPKTSAGRCPTLELRGECLRESRSNDWLDSKTERTEMLVNAASFPGPALWQGLMLCAIPLWSWFALRKDGKHIAIATGLYVGFGIALAVAIIAA